MRLRRVFAAMGVTALALSSLVGTAGAQTQGPVASRQGDDGQHFGRVAAGCKGGQNLGAPNGDNVSAQDLGPGWESYDSFGAADFKLKRRCQLREIRIDGSSDGVATGISVSFYRNFGTLPDLERPIAGCDFPNQPGTGPDFVITVFDDRCELLKARYWMVVQVHQDFDTQGQWFWSMTGNAVQFGDTWRNPGGGYGTPCTDFDRIPICLAGPPVTEYMFSLSP